MGIGMIVFYFGSKRLPNTIWKKGNDLSLPSNAGLSDHQTKPKILLIVLLSFFSIFFWMAFEQMGSSLNLFALRNTDRSILGVEIPASVLQSINPLFILLFGPLVSILWTSLAKKTGTQILF